MPSFLFSCASESYRDAVAELKALYPTARISRLADDAGLMAVEDLTLERLAQACRVRPALFVRHLTEVRETVPLSDVGEGLPLLSAAVRALAEEWSPLAPLSLQVWTAEGAPAGHHAEIDKVLRAMLAEMGREVRRAGSPKVIHVCATRRGLILACASTADTLCDWPGGRVRLRHDPDQVSRSEHKLEEALMVFALPAPDGGVAVDLGASPGGWTRVLAARGFSVHAVDPAELAPSVMRAAHVVHEKTTAGRFLAETRLRCDLVVNDMRMDPLTSCETMLQAARILKPGGLAVVTLKLPETHPVPVAQQALAVLRRGYEIVEARQLYSNRREATVALKKANQL